MKNLLSHMNLYDMITLFVFSIPVMFVYLIICLIYVKKIDKAPKEIAKHGLSRFVLIGLLVLFMFILFDTVIEFFSAFFYQYYKTIPNHESESIIFKNMCERTRTFPINILINFTTFCTFLYAGAEGAIAGMKTLQVDSGLCIELPDIKRRRLKIVFLSWCYVGIIANIYQYIIGGEIVDFNLTEIYIGLGTSLAIMFIAERSPQMLANKTIKSADTTTKIDLSKMVMDIPSSRKITIEEENSELIADKVICEEEILQSKDL